MSDFKNASESSKEEFKKFNSEQDKLNILLKSSFDKTSIQKIIDSLPSYVLLVDEDHHIIMANKSVEYDLGVSPESIIGHHCPKIIHGCDKPVPECPLEKSVEKGCAVEVEFFDEEYNRWLKSSIYPSELKTNDDKKIYFHMVQDISDKKEIEEGLKESIEKMNRILEAGIQALIKVVEKRDPYTSGNQQRVGKLAYRIAKEMKLTNEQAEAVRIAGFLHDIGKVAIPIEILCKPGKISENEFNIIKGHVISGHEILKDIDFPWAIADMVLQHHERLNGSGYPNKLREEDMMIEAKILCVADVVEAMTSHRPYRPAIGIEKALEEIAENSGILYDKAVVETCIKLFVETKYCFDS